MNEVEGLPEGIVNEAITFAYLNGLVVQSAECKPSQNSPFSCITHIPFALLPSKYPLSVFENLEKVQPIFHELVYKMSKDFLYLEKTLEQTAQSDEFTGKLLEIAKKSYGKPKEGHSPGYLGLWRSDYMFHSSSDEIIPKQIEFNTMSVSYAALSQRMSSLHRFITSKVAAHKKSPPPTLPKNSSSDEFVGALYEAWEIYNNPCSIVIFVVQPGETNIYDQKHLEHGLVTRGVKVVRASLLEIYEKGELRDHTLFYDSQEVAVAYFRAGYTPTDYPTQQEWKGREMVDLSKTISCPDCSTQLVGCKKIQQLWATEGIVEKYITNPQMSSFLRSFFAGLYSLNEEEYSEKKELSALLEKVEAHPQGYVLKPQREGGGHNFYGEEMVKQLKTLSPQERAAFILMERIYPSSSLCLHIRENNCTPYESIGELGVYGALVRREKGEEGGEREGEINRFVGYLLRTKNILSDEGGVASGYAVIDTVECV